MPVILQEEEYCSETLPQGRLSGFKVRVVCLVFFFLAIACTYVQWSLNAFRSLKAEDSGLFLYIGQRLLHGDVLYRDIADNKPPLIYWLNELGLLIGHGSPAGVFFLCLVSGMLTFAILYYGSRPYVGWQLFIIAGCWSQLAFLACALHPNYTESFALPLTVLGGVLFVREFLNRDEEGAWYAPAQGAIATLLFCLRANNVGVSIIYFLYLVLQLRKSGRFRQLCRFVLGAVVVYGLVLLPLALQGTVQDYVMNVFRLAAPYTSGTTIVARLRAFWHGLILLGQAPLLYFSFACGATLVIAQRASRYARLVLWLGAWFVLEIAMSATSGYRWDHYYLLWIPPLALIMMLAGSVLFEDGLNSPLPIALAVSLVLVLLNQSVINGYHTVSYPRTEDPAVALARTYAGSKDRLTTWGFFYHDLWFDLGLPSGTRWFHEGAFTNRKIYQALVPAFLSDMEKNRPRIVIERPCAVPLFAHANPALPLNDAFAAEYFRGWDNPGIVKRKAALARLYRPVTEKSGLVVYLRRE